MRILVWNCMNGISRPEQISILQKLNPDIAIIPEMKKSNIDIIKPDDAIWKTNNHSNKHPKGLGILSFNGAQISPLQFDEDMELYIPVKVVFKNISFNLLAVWNFYYACKQGRFKGVKGENCLEWSAIRHYTKTLDYPLLIGGDWNFGPTFSTKSFVDMCNRFETNQIKSLYHHFNNLDFHESKHSTFRHSSGKLHHLDHFFGSSFFYENINDYHVQTFNEIVLSDHVPIILDLKVN